MTGVYCTNCGHLNPEGSNFCASCGTPLAAAAGERTLRLHAVDPMQDAPGPQDDVVVELDEVSGSGVLVVRAGSMAGQRLPLDRPLTRLGRHPQSDISLDDITVSRRHADIERLADGTAYEIRDAGSLNGTYVNGERVEKTTLSNGDEVQIGKFRMVFLDALGGTA